MQTFGRAESAEDDGNFAWSDGPVMCMLATHAGPDKRITLYAITANHKLVISSYPVLQSTCRYIGALEHHGREAGGSCFPPPKKIWAVGKL